MSLPSPGNADADVERGAPGPAPLGRAEARRVTSAGLADLAERQADAVAALDRALEARLGELDQAFATRRAHLEGHLREAEGALVDAVHVGISEFKRVASDERRLLAEAAAGELADLERAAAHRLGELEAAFAIHEASMGDLVDRLEELERATRDRLGEEGATAG